MNDYPPPLPGCPNLSIVKTEPEDDDSHISDSLPGHDPIESVDPRLRPSSTGTMTREMAGLPHHDETVGSESSRTGRIPHLVRQGPTYEETKEVIKLDTMADLEGLIPSSTPGNDMIDFTLNSFLILQGIRLKALEACIDISEQEFQAKLNEIRMLYRTRLGQFQSELEKAVKKVRDSLEAIADERVVTIDEVDAKVEEMKKIFMHHILALRSRACTRIHELCKEYNTRTQRSVTSENREILMRWWNEHIDHPYPTLEEKMDLSARTNMTMKHVTNWFSNKRSREARKRQKRQREDEDGAPEEMLAVVKTEEEDSTVYSSSPPLYSSHASDGSSTSSACTSPAPLLPQYGRPSPAESSFASDAMDPVVSHHAGHEGYPSSVAPSAISNWVPEYGTGIPQSDQLIVNDHLSSYVETMKDHIAEQEDIFKEAEANAAHIASMFFATEEEMASLKQFNDQFLDVDVEISKRKPDNDPVLNAWFEAHSEHPYPTSEEKKELSRQTGFTVTQLSYWFTNRRRRKWDRPG